MDAVIAARANGVSLAAHRRAARRLRPSRPTAILSRHRSKLTDSPPKRSDVPIPDGHDDVVPSPIMSGLGQCGEWHHSPVPLVIRNATSAGIDLVVSSRLDFLREVRGPDRPNAADLEFETRSFIVAESDAGRLHTWIETLTSSQESCQSSSGRDPHKLRIIESRRATSSTCSCHLINSGEASASGYSSTASTAPKSLGLADLCCTPPMRDAASTSPAFRPEARWMELVVAP